MLRCEFHLFSERDLPGVYSYRPGIFLTVNCYVNDLYCRYPTTTVFAAVTTSARLMVLDAVLTGTIST